MKLLLRFLKKLCGVKLPFLLFGIYCEVFEVVKSRPNRKSYGLDGLNSECLKHADPLLCLLLSICYTCHNP